MKFKLFGKQLSLGEGPVENVKTRAKAYVVGQGLDLTQDPQRNFRTMRNLRNIYLNGGYIAEGVDLFPLYAIGNGYELECDEEKGDAETAEQTIQEFLDAINFYDINWQLMTDAEVVRDGIAEIVYGRGALGKVPVNVVVRPAECFEFDTDVKGRILSYTQVADNRGNTIQPIVLPPSSVMHYQFLSRSDSPYGVSVIERCLHDIRRDTKVTEATTAAICLHGTPKWHVRINATNPNAMPLSDEDYDDVKAQFDKFDAKSQFVTEGDLELKMLDSTGVPNVQQYSEVTQMRVIAGMGVPGELLGLRQGTTDATAVTRVGAFFKKVKSVQRDIEMMWNNIFDQITGVPGLVKLQLNDTDPADFSKMASAIAALRTGVDPDAIVPADWAREQLGVPADERDESELPQQNSVPQDTAGLQDWLMKQSQGLPTGQGTEGADTVGNASQLKQ